MNKKVIVSICAVLVCALIGLKLFVLKDTKKENKTSNDTSNSTLKELPKPEVTGGQRGELGIDKNINESNIDEYLGREDAVYRDMRMLEDPATYENIGGDRFLSGYIKGFEVIPLPYLIPVEGLPSEVGKTYAGKTLFSLVDGKYEANYEESMKIIEEIFPKDKVIFLMCGGGGYAGMTKQFLVSLGYDENKIYNVGGYWYYEGKNNIEVKKVVNGKTVYDFDSVPYHNIEFDKLTLNKNAKINSEVTGIKINTNKQTIEEGQSFQLKAIVLPNEATNKNVRWVSSNEKIATVDSNGLVSAKSAGNVKIKAITEDGNKFVSCNITVTSASKGDVIKLDALTNEYKEFSDSDLEKIDNKYSYLDDPDVEHSKYHTYNGEGYAVNDLGRAEYAKKEKEKEAALKTRTKIINDLINNKRNFIVLIDVGSCQSLPYSPMEGAKKILSSRNIPYFLFYTRSEDTFNNSKIHFKYFSSGAVIIVKEGKVYKYIDSDKDSFKNDTEVLNWLKRYIEIK